MRAHVLAVARLAAAVLVLGVPQGARADESGYKIDLPGLGQASISKSAAECGSGAGPGAIVGQIAPSRGVEMPHYVSVSPVNAISKSVFGGIHQEFSARPGESAQQLVVNKSLADYKSEGDLAMKMSDFREQQKLALVTPDGHFACRGIAAGAYTVFATVYQKTAPKAPYDKLGLKEILVIRYYTAQVAIPKGDPHAVVRADRFTLIGTSPPGM